MDQESRRFLVSDPVLLSANRAFMIEQTKRSHKVLPFVPAKPSQEEGKLEKWFHGVIQSNHDLMTALERLSDSYKGLLGGEPMTERDQAVLLAVQVTLNNARNAQNLS